MDTDWPELPRYTDDELLSFYHNGGLINLNDTEVEYLAQLLTDQFCIESIRQAKQRWFLFKRKVAITLCLLYLGYIILNTLIGGSA